MFVPLTSILLSSGRKCLKRADRNGEARSGKAVRDVGVSTAVADVYLKKHVCLLDPWPEPFLRSLAHENERVVPLATTSWGQGVQTPRLFNSLSISILNKLKIGFSESVTEPL